MERQKVLIRLDIQVNSSSSQMQQAQILAVCESFERCLSRVPDLGACFYRQLSENHPETRAVFENVNMQSQHTRFIGMLSIILNRMKSGRAIDSLLRDLGEQHQKFGVMPEHFQVFASTLVRMVETSLDEPFDASLRRAWDDAMEVITRSMQVTETS